MSDHDRLAEVLAVLESGPWFWNRSVERGTMAYFMRATDGWNFHAHFTDAEANAVRDALNSVASRLSTQEEK